jgi:predicted CXXCH cytochrome family protein
MQGPMILIIDACSGNPHNNVMKVLSVLVMILCLLLALASRPEAACSECHSKNPKMRQMHEALGYKDCFRCHGFGQGKKSPAERAAQMTSDPLCIGCHNQ